ncbi:MAG: aconitase X catalytic domain-containing protein [Archaeoglobus sp.]|nr:aconitase X catalytic domain-containing protein [Archaeoglobus sp.]
MYLTKEEEKLLYSENQTIRKSMEILVALGEIFGADRLVKIKSVQISGISYQNIGDAGLEWFESLRGKFAVRAMLNPAGMDLERWKEMGIDEGFYRKQLRIVKALVNLGAEPTLTCTPYYFDPPSSGDHVAWAESNAVVYANSILGARTNRESGISALAAGIIGKTPNYGFHLDENRRPTVLVEVKTEMKSEAMISMLGYELGEKLSNEVPYFRFEDKIPQDWLKGLAASLAAKGNTALFHVENQTPEWNSFPVNYLEKIEVEKVGGEESETFKCDPDLIALGCPHLSERELENLFDLVKNRGKVKKDFWVFTSKEIIKKRADLVEKLEKHGVKVFGDTCMVVSPATENYECVMVNSGKALTYLPKLRKVDVRFGSMKECVEVAFV